MLSMKNKEHSNIMKFLFLLFYAVMLSGLTRCGSSDNKKDGPAPVDECRFVNPIAAGHDPWVIKHGDIYYFIESSGRAIHVSKTNELTQLKANQRQVFQLSSTGWNRHNLWAPELHYFDGKWYIYYAAGESGPPFIHQRSGVLQSVTDDPQGEYTDMGQLYTGDNLETGENNKWAIDLTVLDLNDQLYAIWSGWIENRLTDNTPQHLYIAKMDNPWTISTNRVKLASPEESWEIGGPLNLVEGPQILTNNSGDIFIIYSTRESWMPEYRLGQLRLIDRNADPMNPDNWVKSGPVFAGTPNIHGVGHASFTKSPDDTEDWIVYHTKVSPDPGWDRLIHIQPFTWHEDGSPNFGVPVAPQTYIPKPSGECD
jgi:GH43 family beta-xylosidase